MLAYRGEPPTWGRHYESVNSNYSFWFIKRGEARVRRGTEVTTVHESQWVLFPAHTRKRQDFSDGCELYSLGFEAWWSTGFPWMRFESPVQVSSSIDDLVVQSATRAIDLLPANRTPGYRMLSQQFVTAAVFMEFHSELLRLLACLTPILIDHGAEISPASGGDTRIDRVVRDLHKSPSIRPLPYRRWQKEIGLSRVRIDRLAREKFSLTPKQLRDRYLLAALKRLLLARDVSAKEAALEFGFSDSSHLCRWFRQHAGVSPVTFRTKGSL